MKVSLKFSINKIPLPVKAAFWFTFCNLIVSGINFLSSMLFSWFLPKEEYGKISIFNSYQQIILILATWEIQLGAYSRGYLKYKENSSFFTTSMQALTNMMTVFVFALILFFFKPFSIFTDINGLTLLCLFLFIIVRPSYNAWLTRKRYTYDYKSAVFVTILFACSNVLIPFAAIFLLGKTAEIKNCATLLGGTFVCGLLWIKNANYKSLFNRVETKEYWKFMLLFEGPLVLHSLSYMVLSQSDRIMIGKLVGNEQAALYSVAYSIAIVITLLQSSIDQAFGPWRYLQLEKNNYTAINKISSIVLIMYAIVVCCFILIAPDLIRIFYSAEYAEGIWCIPPITASAFFMFLYSMFVNMETYYEKTKYVPMVSITCGLINIGLNFVFIKIYGYIACAYTTLFSYILFSIGHYLFMRHVLKREGIFVEIYNYGQMFIIGFMVVVFSAFSTFIYDSYIIRYGIILAVGIIALFNRTKIMEIFHTIRDK